MKEYAVQWRPGGIFDEPWMLSDKPTASKLEALKTLLALRRLPDAQYCDYRVVKRKVTEWKETD